MFKRQKVQEAILVTPYWKTQYWYPMILALSKEPPLIIPINKKWNLAAWKLSKPSIRKTSHRKRTHQLYNCIWSLWTSWCKKQQPAINNLQYGPKNILMFLAQQQHYSYQYLNKRPEVILPKKQQLETWDLGILPRYMVKNYSNNDTLSLPQLQEKGDLTTLYSYDVETSI
ncbi:hypothetical protein BCV71DRAFT_284120 [Rhizopus microsporus]|uniref:Uncharacterized protein n=1 Tax=Rhizopus microsporus TaxID=58291 RepID=A0A1X0SF36_RHIZD|nr:hypothetical protein BCV71DRAFT_284120 [Rhizopus microsporus]